MPFCERRQNALQKAAFHRVKDGQSQRVLPSFASRPVTALAAVVLKYAKNRPSPYPFRRLGCSNSKATLKHHTYAYRQKHIHRRSEKAGRPAPAHGRIDGRRIGPRQVYNQRPRGRRANELPGSTVELLSAKDSSVIKSVVADVPSYNDARGSFQSSIFSFDVPRVKGAQYIIRASYLGFKTECVNVNLDNMSRREFERTLPDITLHRESKVLDEVNVVATKVKFYYKGDTVVYNADAFVLAEGSMLDGLVRQLPGVEIRDDGNIYHNGKLVENLLLNGKEFFNNNNQIMLDMLPAFTVKNIKMYDKYGHTSELLGQQRQDDKLYVMDVVLKREYNIGWMGNAEGGGGTSGRYLGQLFAMRHTDHSRITLYGAINNLNDKRKPGQDSNWSPDQLSPGRSKEIQGGIDYYIGDREGKYILNGNVQVGHSDLDLVENTDKVNFLPTNDTYEYIRSQSRNKSFNVNTWHQCHARRHLQRAAERHEPRDIGKFVFASRLSRPAPRHGVPLQYRVARQGTYPKRGTLGQQHAEAKQLW